MLQYNKYNTGQFKRQFKPMDAPRIKMLIQADAKHCYCDTAQSRLSKAGIEQLKWHIITIEARPGVMRLVLHKAITGIDPVFKC